MQNTAEMPESIRLPDKIFSCHCKLFQIRLFPMSKKIYIRYLVPILSCLILCACEQVWNSPYTDSFEGSVLRASFSERPKYLDPARSYSSSEAVFVGQIYDCLLYTSPSPRDRQKSRMPSSA